MAIHKQKPKLVTCPKKPTPPGPPAGPVVGPGVEGSAIFTVFENALDLGVEHAVEHTPDPDVDAPGELTPEAEENAERFGTIDNADSPTDNSPEGAGTEGAKQK